MSPFSPSLSTRLDYYMPLLTEFSSTITSIGGRHYDGKVFDQLLGSCDSHLSPSLRKLMLNIRYTNMEWGQECERYHADKWTKDLVSPLATWVLSFARDNNFFFLWHQSLDCTIFTSRVVQVDGTKILKCFEINARCNLMDDVMSKD